MTKTMMEQHLAVDGLPECERCDWLMDILVRFGAGLDRHNQELINSMATGGEHSKNNEVFKGRALQQVVIMMMFDEIMQTELIVNVTTH